MAWRLIRALEGRRLNRAKMTRNVSEGPAVEGTTDVTTLLLRGGVTLRAHLWLEHARAHFTQIDIVEVEVKWFSLLHVTRYLFLGKGPVRHHPGIEIGR
jgi:hypothetical protein